MNYLGKALQASSEKFYHEFSLDRIPKDGFKSLFDSLTHPDSSSVRLMQLTFAKSMDKYIECLPLN